MIVHFKHMAAKANYLKIIHVVVLLFIINQAFSQSITNTGEQTNTSSSFVNQNGEVSSSGVLNKNGKLLSLAALTTNSISDISGITATCGGNITDNGGAEIFERGVCWSTNVNPTINDNIDIEGSGGGSYTSSLTGLSLGTTYYVRAYAKNSVGVSYGNEQMFTTLDIPTLTTDNPSNVAPVSATCGGNITDDGGSPVTQRGVCWSTSYNPTISDSKSDDGTGTGSFSSFIFLLNENTTYYLRAYATNIAGTAYGNQQVITSSSFPNCGYAVDIDGNTYNTVQIGSQCWLKENLKVLHTPEGAAIPHVSNDIDWGNLTSTDKAWCYYDDNFSNVNIYGVLYTWSAIMNDEESSAENPSGVQGICPDGWHLPSDEEWKELEIYLGMSQENADQTGWREPDVASKMAGNAALWNDGELKTNVEFGNSGFTGIPGGTRNFWGHSANLGTMGYWHSATDAGLWYGWGREISANNETIYRGNMAKNAGYSVRCVKD